MHRLEQRHVQKGEVNARAELLVEHLVAQPDALASGEFCRRFRIGNILLAHRMESRFGHGAHKRAIAIVITFYARIAAEPLESGDCRIS